jgi:Mn2+/Fe2+ NRAMP family transporter
VSETERGRHPTADEHLPPAHDDWQSEGASVVELSDLLGTPVRTADGERSGRVGAALLAASILPLSTAYSVSEFVGRESALDDRPREAPLFYGTYAAVMVVSTAIVLVPGAPLVTILVATQVVNAVLLLPLLVAMYGIGRDPEVMGDHTAGRWAATGYLLTIVLVAVCVGGLAVVGAA